MTVLAEDRKVASITRMVWSSAKAGLRGHLPVRHVPTILELTDAETAAVAIEVRNAAILIDRAYSKTGIAIWQNNGAPAGQEISHVHFHVAGTLDGGGTEFGAVEEGLSKTWHRA